MRTSGNTYKHQWEMPLVFAVSLFLAGLILVAVFVFSQQSAPSPAARLSSGAIKPANLTAATPLSFSQPVRIHIPAIGAQSKVISIGKDADGSMSVPAKADFDKAAWYKHSPAPGQTGTSVVEGHVDFAGKGPGVFFELGKLKAGDQIEITRQDGKTAVFTIYKAGVYKKDQFPTAEVYGPASQPALALITCGGDFSRADRHYDSNVIVFSSLTSVK